ncbi:cell envelope biogenesis protein TolA [Marivita sp.]|uniref:cell envelope biogenesis protein TolA n=1 Tax=Marivita sp. TaxID=2003365 RepID=UPI0025C2A489|nr:cell envelope biogenesis protein TolA [Marivita sp.]
MHTGHYISGGAHGLLIVWALFGGMFRSDPPQLEIADVSVISEAEFAAMMRPQVAPPPVEEPEALPQPEIEDAAPEPPVPETQPEPRPEPAEPEAAAPDPVPDPVLPTPEPEISDVAPQPPAPEPVPDVEAPDIALRPIPRPAPRVAPEAVPEPEPDAEVAPEVQETVERSETPDVTDAEEQQATSPEAATTEIVTEAEDPARAPTASMRPQVRPNRPAPEATAAAPEAATPAPEEPAPQAPAPTEDATASAIAGALEEALSGSPSGTVDGPPLTEAETDGFRIAVQDCWVVDVGSQAANVTVTVGFDMDRSGQVVGASLRMLSSEGGTGSAAETAFQAARRAILRCQGDGYNLPPEKFDQWKRVEMTFNPESMRIR